MSTFLLGQVRELRKLLQTCSIRGVLEILEAQKNEKTKQFKKFVEKQMLSCRISDVWVQVSGAVERAEQMPRGSSGSGSSQALLITTTITTITNY